MTDDPFGGNPESIDRRVSVFQAAFDSDCGNCTSGIEEGELIKSDGTGGWIHADCEDLVTMPIRGMCMTCFTVRTPRGACNCD